MTENDVRRIIGTEAAGDPKGDIPCGSGHVLRDEDGEEIDSTVSEVF